MPSSFIFFYQNMGQESTTAKSQSLQCETINAPAFTEAQISLDEGSVLRPNGFFPPEIIINIIQHADLIDCARSSQSCKLWYESIREAYQSIYITKYGKEKSSEGDWKANFFRRTLADRNLKKGLWWAEALSTVQAQNSGMYSYVVSFEGNKMIVNNHVMYVSSYENSKGGESAYLVNLDTMKREPIPYGTMFANGFKLTTLITNNSHYLDWNEFSVDDGTTKRIIKRKREVPPVVQNRWMPLQNYCELFVNKDGSQTVMTTNIFKETYEYETLAAYEHNMEIVDLCTGEIIAELQLTVKRIRGLIGEEVIADFDDGLHFVNIFTNEHRTLPYAQSNYDVYYCQESHRIGFIHADEGIVIHEWPSLNMVSRIDICAKFDISQNARPKIKSFAFDKSKLVVALQICSIFYAVFDIHTGELMQTFYNPSDGLDSFGEGDYKTIHLAPNGKIVTDYANLTVYDFISPKIDKKIPVVLVEPDIIHGECRMADKVVISYIPSTDLADFALKKLDVPIEHIAHRTLFKEEKGVQYRITGIGSHYKDQEAYHTSDAYVQWLQVARYLESWHYKRDVKNSLQITKCNVNNPGAGYRDNLMWTNLRQVLFIYERFNEVTNEWEFTEPIGLEEWADPSTVPTKKKIGMNSLNEIH